MEMNTNKKFSVGIVVISLIIGLFVGFYFGNSKREAVSGIHVMPDGTVMENDSMDMAQMMADMNKALLGKTGDEFDETFLREMIIHHEGAVEMAKLALTNAKHSEIKDLAGAIISAQNKEIADMITWMNTWYMMDE